jgi:hypothetical protein
MRVDGILWGRRLPSAGGGPVLRRWPALRAGHRQNPPPFRRFLIANGMRLPIAPLSPRLLRLRIRFRRHRPGHFLPIAPAPKPVVQTSCTKPPPPAPSYTTPSPPLSSETALPIPPSLPSALAPASIPLAPLPNLCLPTSSIPPAPYYFTHRYAYYLLHLLQSLPSP